MKVFTWPWEKQLCVHNFFLILLQTKGPTFIISYSFQRDIGNKMVQEIRTFLRCCDFVDSKLTSPLTSFARPAKIIEGFWTWMANWISGSGISVFDLFFHMGSSVQQPELGWPPPKLFQNLKFVKKKWITKNKLHVNMCHNHFNKNQITHYCSSTWSGSCSSIKDAQQSHAGLKLTAAFN